MQNNLITEFKTFIALTLKFNLFLLMLISFSTVAITLQLSPPNNPKRFLMRYLPHWHGVETSISDFNWNKAHSQAVYTIVEGPKLRTGESWHTLYSLTRNSSHILRLYSWREPGEKRLSSINWSPDGSRVVALSSYYGSSVNADGIQIIDIDPQNTRIRELSRDFNQRVGSGSILPKPRYFEFSPSGKYLLLIMGSNRDATTNKRIVRIEYKSGRRKALTSSRMAAFAARWSPDGKHIAYIAVPDSGGVTFRSGKTHDEQNKNQHLYVMTNGGHHKRRLAFDKQYFEADPVWSKDGQIILFVRFQSSVSKSGKSLWRVNPDGTALKRVRALE